MIPMTPSKLSINKVFIMEPKKMKRTLPPRKTSKSSKRLRFSEFSSLTLTEPKSRADLQNSWYTKKEMAQFKRKVRLTSQALRETKAAKAMKRIACSAATGSPQASINLHLKEVICGIEHLISPQVLQLLLDRRRKTIARVLEDQQAQKEAGVGVDPLITAQVSAINSSFSKEWCSRITQFQHA
mmetsp:Transcript_8201/g.18411  ORF Transcript_8201/g.18411 Transcript_8201/m.18411 type:complete len:184 (-) Transcript_8201:1129-1680(-)